MEERAAIPPGLPRLNPTISYWQDPPSDIGCLRSTASLPEKADYIVIGSGISGSCIAYNLLCRQPKAKVVLLEARRAVSGATGRNGGHTKAASYRSFLEHERELGLEEAIKIAKLEYANIVATHAFAKTHGIDCASTECQTFDIVYCQTQFVLGKQAIGRMRQTMEDHPAAQYKIWDADEAKEKFLTPNACGAFEYYAGSLSAYQLAIGVLKLALAKGLNPQTTTPATSLWSEPCSGKTQWTVQTPRGSIAAPEIVLATNGYSAHLLPMLQGAIVPLHGQICAQRPGLGLPHTGLGNAYSFIHETGYEYMISRPPGTPDTGTITIGGGLWKLENNGASRYGETNDTALEPSITLFLRDCTEEYFGPENWGADHASGRVKKEWSGIMGASADGLPYVGALTDTQGLWISAGFHGHGMVWCLKAAEALAVMMVGSEAEYREMEEWFPRSAVCE
ncbi:hypothetical protein LTR78_007547 [Recurvomyces mirabilis]|uniref:FAD dependent oxidoreductase domain-containing protein n=1 Tax=Recurvomyces mirabilis TaxID=574656 RepID=A0AAE0WI18_9PEZI|nr:hypothetical protein LTR78_007547 [Recurvomyces mirabilis]KAK5159941.1 hypothetical protein LTS14_002047 [Recurvomyces mirabilis]